jgi:hypothetical protein
VYVLGVEGLADLSSPHIYVVDLLDSAVSEVESDNPAAVGHRVVVVENAVGPGGFVTASDVGIGIQYATTVAID